MPTAGNHARAMDRDLQVYLSVLRVKMSTMNEIRVYCDTETTGTHFARRPWEIALIRCEPGQDPRELLVYIDVRDIDLAHAQPQALEIGRFEQRHPQRNGTLPEGALLVREKAAAELVRDWTAGSHIYGVATSFDTETLSAVLRRHRMEAPWHFLPECMIVMSKGYLRALGITPVRSSDGISRQCGVEPPVGLDRHSALGDARWTRRWHEQLIAPAQPLAA